MRVKFGPWTPDQPDLDSGGLEECVNCLPVDAWYEAVRGERTLSGTNSVPSTAKLYPASVNVAGSLDRAYMHIGAGTTGGINIYEFTLDGTTLSRSTVSRTATYTVATFVFARFGDSMIASNGTDAMQVQPTIGSTNFRDMSASASAPLARALATVRDFVFAATSEGTGRNRVRWCQINNPQRWTANPRLQSDFQDLPDTGPIVAITGGEFGVILTQQAVWRATYVGSPLIFRFDKVVENIQCIEPFAAARYQNVTFFLAVNGVMMFDGQQAFPIGSNAVNQYIRETLGTQTLGVRAAIDPANRLYVLGFPNIGELLVYSIDTRRWTQVSTDAGILTPSIVVANQLMTGGTPAVQDTAQLGVGLVSSVANRYVEFIGTTYKTATFATGEAQLFPDRRAFVRGVRPLIQGAHDSSGTATTAITVQVGERNVLTESASYGSAVSVNANGLAPLRSDARYHRVRVNVSGGFERAIGFDFDARRSGKR